MIVESGLWKEKEKGKGKGKEEVEEGDEGGGWSGDVMVVYSAQAINSQAINSNAALGSVRAQYSKRCSLKEDRDSPR